MKKTVAKETEENTESSMTADPQGFAEAPAHWLGHRERLRQRFRDAGSEALADYELLEMLLFRAVIRKDVKPMAKALMAKFGSFAEVLSAPEIRLKEVKGISDSIVTELKLVKAAAERFGKSKVIKKSVITGWDSLMDYIKTTMAYAQKEQFRILFLDKRHTLIADEVQQEGTIDHTPVYPREIVKRALELSATGIILVHNHPSGDPTPSNMDIQMTRQITTIAKQLSIDVHDHLIVGKEGIASFRSLKLI